MDRKFLNGKFGNHFHDVKPSPSFVDEALENDEDTSLLRAKVEEPRLRYDVEVVTKLIVYLGINCFIQALILGIGFLSVDLLPVAFRALGLSAIHT